jgi:hypothetical protein
MPVPTIFLINDAGEIVEMSDQRYDSEQLLQELLAKYPSVLAGDQLSGAAPVRWLFVAREAGIPDEENGANRWSLDHIFLDQNAIPTFVEVKRSSDTRIRREVVGQMLDYAANAVIYWPLGTIKQRFEETCRDQELEPENVVADFLGVDASLEAGGMIARFWEAVNTNLQVGKVRLIFAADEIPTELRRVVEFLNEQMNPAEVLAIEIRQYVGTGVRTLVPSVIQSVKRATANSQPSTQWNHESFVAALRVRSGAECVSVATRVFEWVDTRCSGYWWGRGQRDGSCFPKFRQAGVDFYPFALWTYGRIEVQFHLLLQRSIPRDIVETLASRLNVIPGVAVATESLPKRFPFDMSLLSDSQAMGQFFDALGWLMNQLKA